MDFVEICKVYVRKMIIKAAKRIFNFDKICRSYSDLNFGVTFLEHSVDGQGSTVNAFPTCTLVHCNGLLSLFVAIRAQA